MWNAEADVLQQQKTTPGVTAVSEEQETEAAIKTDSAELDQRRLETRSLVWSVWISAATFRWSEFEGNTMKAWIHPAWYQHFRMMIVVVVVLWCGTLWTPSH